MAPGPRAGSFSVLHSTVTAEGVVGAAALLVAPLGAETSTTAAGGGAAHPAELPIAVWYTSAMRILFAAIMVPSLAVLGCGSQKNEADVSTSATAPSSGSPVVAGVSARPAASSSAAAPGPSAGSVTSGACAKDADCDWDDPCRATVCLVKPRAGPECDKSLPPPGDCLCMAGACTLKPKKPPVPVGPCERAGCVVDAGHGTCVADTKGLPASQRFSLPIDAGPSCDCDADVGCVFHWFDPVPCKSDDDCWIEENPRVHPVPRSKGHAPFRPCKDGETSPKCGPEGVCTHGSKWKC